MYYLDEKSLGKPQRRILELERQIRDREDEISDLAMLEDLYCKQPNKKIKSVKDAKNFLKRCNQLESIKRRVRAIKEFDDLINPEIEYFSPSETHLFSLKKAPLKITNIDEFIRKSPLLFTDDDVNQIKNQRTLLYNAINNTIETFKELNPLFQEGNKDYLIQQIIDKFNLMDEPLSDPNIIKELNKMYKYQQMKQAIKKQTFQPSSIQKQNNIQKYQEITLTPQSSKTLIDINKNIILYNKYVDSYFNEQDPLNIFHRLTALDDIIDKIKIPINDIINAFDTDDLDRKYAQAFLQFLDDQQQIINKEINDLITSSTKI